MRMSNSGFPPIVHPAAGSIVHPLSSKSDETQMEDPRPLQTRRAVGVVIALAGLALAVVSVLGLLSSTTNLGSLNSSEAGALAFFLISVGLVLFGRKV